MAASGASAASGEAVYRQKCSACHDSGAGNAPRTGVPADWSVRFARGRALLHAAAIRGVPDTAMAPKGGFAELSDAEVRAAVDHMLATTGFVEPPPSAARGDSRAAPEAVASSAPHSVQAHAGDAARRVATAVRDAVAPAAGLDLHDDEIVLRGVGMRVRVEAGRVRLMGVVPDAAAVQRAEAAARAVPGVVSVENRLVTGGMLDFD